MVQAIWNGKVIAESNNTKVVEGNHYFPPDALDRSFVRPSGTTSVCPWKGTASYYTLEVDGEQNKDAGWYYPDPLPKAEAMGIRDHVAFWKGVEVR